MRHPSWRRFAGCFDDRCDAPNDDIFVRNFNARGLAFALNSSGNGCCCGAYVSDNQTERFELRLLCSQVGVELGRANMLTDATVVVNADNRCTHGFALLEVSVPLSPTSLDALAVIYSFVPWAGCTILAIVVAKRWSEEAYAARIVCLLLAAMLTVNELILKKLLQEPRPDRSCLLSHGMPSSHSLLSIGVLAYVALELVWGDCSLNGFRQWSRRDAIALFCALVLLLGPVPFSRVHLHDHHSSQVAIGSALGVTLASVFFFSHYAWAVKRRRRRRSSGHQ